MLRMGSPRPRIDPLRSWAGFPMSGMGPFRSGTGIFRSRMCPLGPVTATIWSVMVPSGLSSVLSSMKMALAGMGWPTCDKVGSFQISPERGRSGLKFVLSGLLASRGKPVGHASRSGTLGINRNSVYVEVRSVEHECIAFIVRSRLIPIMTRLRKFSLPPPPLHAYSSPLPLSTPSPTTQGDIWCMVCILYKQITRGDHYYASQLTSSSIEMPSARASIGLSIGQNTKTLSSLHAP